MPSDVEDWIEDLSFSKFAAFDSDYPDVSVHSGFWDSYQEMKPDMMTGLSAALEASGARTILVTGHSLGGAMAELAALDLKINEYPDYNYASYTQGCPRVGNEAFGQLYSALMNVSFREIHQADIVPHLPPMLLNFVHGPTEVWFNEDWTSYSVCNQTMDGEQSSCSDSILAPISVSDHLTYRKVDVGTFCSSAQKAFAKVPTGVANAASKQSPVVDQPAVTPAVEPSAPAPAAAASATHKKPKIILTE